MQSGYNRRMAPTLPLFDAILVWRSGVLDVRGRRFRCALGSGGVRAEKREGDGATPGGSFPLRRLLYRADRVSAPRTALPIEPLAPADGWCDDPTNTAYNRQVRLPIDASAEQLWRNDGLYDVIVMLGYNDDPVVHGRGSAIFLHVARPGHAPTAGCVALALGDLLEVLEGCGPKTQLRIHDRDAPT